MKFDIALAGFLLTFVGALSGWVAWWLNKRQQAIQKAVAAAEKALNDKRDFNHLVNNQIQISSGIANGFKDIEEMLDDLTRQVLEIKSYLIRYGIAPEEMPRRSKQE